MKRRSVIKAGVALPVLAGWLPAALAQAARRVPTPEQTEGPFYPSSLPSETDSDLLSVGGRSYRQGEPLMMSGVVENLEGKPLAGALVEIWQCDHDGHYHHPRDGGLADPDFQGYGQVATNASGQYQFRAMKPVSYPGRTPHIHVKVRRGSRLLLTTQMYVAGESANQRDGVLRAIRDLAQRNALIVSLSRNKSDGAWIANFPLIIDTPA